MTPSNDYLSRLILIIQESPSETGKSFTEFMDYFAWDDDAEIIKTLKEML
jgi:hypothetical protein